MTLDERIKDTTKVLGSLILILAILIAGLIGFTVGIIVISGILAFFCTLWSVDKTKKVLKYQRYKKKRKQELESLVR